MPRFPAVTAKDVIRAAKKLGFEFSRQSGTSHAVYKRPFDKRRVIIPNHPAITVKRKTLAAIISDLGITVEEFRKLLS
jgi:predicted RNA binding protein YcfA (HicA-like mRNA interferase family)